MEKDTGTTLTERIEEIQNQCIKDVHRAFLEATNRLFTADHGNLAGVEKQTPPCSNCVGKDGKGNKFGDITIELHVIDNMLAFIQNSFDFFMDKDNQPSPQIFSGLYEFFDKTRDELHAAYRIYTGHSMLEG